MNLEIKIAVIRSGKKSYEIARAIGWHPSKISQIVSGIYSPSEAEKRQLALELRRTVDELFSAQPQEVA